MDIENKILSMIPAPAGNAWIKSFDDDEKVIYFQQIIGFAAVRDKYGNQRIITLVLSGDGQPDEANGHEVVYSATPPETIIVGQKEMEGKENGKN